MHTEVMTGVSHHILQMHPHARITAYVPPHRSDVWPLFMQVHPSRHRVTVSRTLPRVVPPCDLVVITTAREKWALVPDQMVLRIKHVPSDQGEIGLSPLVHTNHCLVSQVPWFQFYARNLRRGSPVVYVVGIEDWSMTEGSGVNRDLADLKLLVESSQVEVVLVARKLPDRYKLPGVTILQNCSTEDLIHRLLTTNSYVWTCIQSGGVYHQDRLTGCIPLALSCRSKIITDAYTSHIYGNVTFDFVYRTTVTEIVDFLPSDHVPPAAPQPIICDMFQYAVKTSSFFKHGAAYQPFGSNCPPDFV